MTDISPDSVIKLNATERRSVGVLCAVVLARMLGLFLLLPVIAVWAASFEQATPLLIGLCVSGYGLTQMALQIPMGSLSDAIGRRPVIVGGLCLFILGSLLAANADSIYVLVAGRLLQGAGAISAALTAWLADTTRPELRIRSTAILGASIGGSFILALLLGPVLAGVMPVASIFLLSAGMGVLAIIALGFMPKGTGRGSVHVGSVRFKDLLAMSALRLDIVWVFFLHAVLTALFVCLPFSLVERTGQAASSQWSIYLTALLASLLVVIPLLRKTERAAPRAYGQWAWVLLILGLLGIAGSGNQLWLLILSLSLFFCGFNFLEACLPAWVSLSAPTERRGAALGFYSSAQFFGAFCGGLLGALGLNLAGDWARFSLLAAVAGVALTAGLVLAAKGAGDTEN